EGVAAGPPRVPGRIRIRRLPALPVAFVMDGKRCHGCSGGERSNGVVESWSVGVRKYRRALRGHPLHHSTTPLLRSLPLPPHPPDVVQVEGGAGEAFGDAAHRGAQVVRDDLAELARAAGEGGQPVPMPVDLGLDLHRLVELEARAGRAAGEV